MAETFSKKVKNQLAAVEVTKKCCRHTLNDLESVDLAGDCGGELAKIFAKCRCDGCRSAFVRTVFLTCGSLTDPAKSYQLDFTFPAEETADSMRSILADCGFSFGASERRGKRVLYLRDSGGIGDFLAFIGATGAAFDVMNSRIEGDFRGNIQRQVNFDTANIGKVVRSVQKYEDAAQKLKAAGKYDLLPEEVRQTWELREQDKQLSLEELGKLHNPPISKSGVKHRLEKILKAAEEMEE